MNARNVLENIKYGFFKGDFSEYYYTDHLREMNMVKVKGKFRLMERQLIVIGHCGEHLNNFTTKGMN